MKLLSIEYIPGVDFEPLGIVKGTVVQTKNVPNISFLNRMN